MSVKVFGMENCAGCLVVKNLLEFKGVGFEYIDIMNTENMAEAQKRGIRSVPTTYITVDGVEHVFTGSGKPVLDSILLHAGV